METLKFIGLVVVGGLLLAVPGIGLYLGGAVLIFASWMAIKGAFAEPDSRDRSQGPSDRE